MRRRLFFIIASALAARCPATAGTFEIIGTNIGFVPTAISADNSTLIGSSEFGDAILTLVGGTVVIPFGGTLEGVSADGTVVVGESGDPSNYDDNIPWQWTASGGYQPINTVGYSGFNAISITADGATIGLPGISATGPQAYTWNQSSGFTPVPATPSGQIPAVIHLSPDGKSGFGFTANDTPYIWTSSEGSLDIPEIPGTSYDTPEAMTADGSAVFGVVPASGAIFSYSKGTTISLGFPDAEGIVARGSRYMGVDADGDMLVGTEMLGRDTIYPWVWTPESGFQPLQSLLNADSISIGDYNIETIDGISADGNILYGDGLVDGIQPSGWIVYLPEPSGSLLLLPIAAAMLCRRTRLDVSRA